MRTLPEIPCGKVAAVDPWLATLAIPEPAVLCTNGNVENEIELLIEWGIFSTGLPRVVVKCSVLGSHGGETALLPQRIVLVEFGVLDLPEAAIKVHENIILGPLETKRVKVGGKILAAQEIGAVCLNVCVVLVGWAPVKGGGHEVAAFRVFVVIAAELGDVDFT